MRFVGYVLVAMALALALIMLVAGFSVFVIALANWFNVQRQLGIDTQQSQSYDFVSGVGPMLIASLGFSGVLVGVWHHVNCHADGCWRPGRFSVADGAFKLCKRCAVKIGAVPQKIDHAHIKAVHRNAGH